AILEVNYAVSSILDLESLLEEVVTLIHDRFNYPFVHIFTVHTGRRKVIYQAGSGQRSRHLRMNSFAYDLDAPRGIIPYVARTGKPILVNNIEKEPLYLPSKLPPHDTQSEMTIPLLFGNDVLGVLDIQSDKANSFDEQDMELFEGLASGIAIAVRNATLFRSEKWRRQISDSFQDVAGLLSANIELSDLFDRILSELEKDLPCDASAIWLLDEKPEKVNGALPLRLAAVHGVSRQRVIKSRLDSEEVSQTLDHSLDKMTPSIRPVNGPYGPLGFALNFPSNYSSIAVPLRAGENVLGVLTLAHHQDGRYGSEASAISSTFANYAAIAIQNAKLFASAQKEAWSSTVLLQVAEAAQSITSEEELLNTMCRLTPLLVGIDQCAFYLFNEKQESFDMKAWYGFHPTPVELNIKEVDSLPMLKLHATASTIFVQDPINELKLPSLKHSEEENTVVLLPLLARDEVLGAFLISHRADTETGAENRIKDQTLAILQGISQQTSVALENIHLVETRQEEAYITAVLLQVSQAVVTQNNLQDILDTIVHLMPILVGIETCVIYLWDKTTEKFQPSQAIAPNHPLHQYLEEKSFLPGEYPLLDELRATQKMVFCQLENPDLPPEGWTHTDCVTVTNGQTDMLENGANWLIGLPLYVKGEFFGGLVAIEKEVPPRFQAKRIELLNGVAQQISLAVQDDRLKLEMIGQERMAKEMQLAKEIQKSFLPDELPKADGWNFDLRWNTAREVGGDFYDVFLTHDNRIAFSIADVSDKGMPAALYMTVTRTLVRASAQSLHTPARVLERVNELLVMDAKDNGMFITAVLAYLDPTTGDLEYAIAGHNLPLHYQAASSEIFRLNKDGIALGVIEEAKYRDQKLTLAHGDSLVLYTDGVTETFSPEGEQFGEDGLIKTLLKVIKAHPNSVLNELDEKLQKFRVSDELSDDVTLILIQRK
ncbi:MAG: SpoIIE family protein phosphatase, partial [Anaerolineaceae bacterium]|nr:SpoIIE family protein phosphatase [Anaerolineaceae bacterium]